MYFLSSIFFLLQNISLLILVLLVFLKLAKNLVVYLANLNVVKTDEKCFQETCAWVEWDYGTFYVKSVYRHLLNVMCLLVATGKHLELNFVRCKGALLSNARNLPLRKWKLSQDLSILLLFHLISCLEKVYFITNMSSTLVEIKLIFLVNFSRYTRDVHEVTSEMKTMLGNKVFFNHLNQCLSYWFRKL